MKIQREELNGKSAFDFCRGVVARGLTVDESLEVYRGNTLAYTVTSIKWGAGRVLRETSEKGFSFEKYKSMTEKDKQRLAERKRND